MTAFFNDEDLNGDCFIAGDTGETEEKLVHRIVYIPAGTPTASQPLVQVKLSNLQMVDLVNVNYYALKTHVAGISDADAAKIAWIRALAVREGLISEKFRAAMYNCRYSEVQIVAPTDGVTLAAAIFAVAPVGTVVHDGAIGSVHQLARVVLDAKTRSDLRKNFATYVSCVAYMFRVRGHHWLADINERFEDLWKRCLKDGVNPGVKWEFIAHHALHAVYPVVLDQFWINMANSGSIPGTLVKRIDASPAGVAGIRALDVGMQDLANTVPGFKHLNKEHYDEVGKFVERLKDERWAGSINRKFYGGTAVDFNEARFGSIAATVLAALNNFASNSPLKNSQALQRMARNAPISGSFVARLISAAANDPENAKGLVRIPESE